MRRVFLSFFTRAINHDHLSASRVNRSFGKLIKSLVNDLSPLIIMTLITSPLYCLPSSTRNMWPIFLFFETALAAFLPVEIFEMRIKQNYIRKRDYGKVIIESSKYSNNLVFFTYHLSLHRGRLIFSRNFQQPPIQSISCQFSRLASTRFVHAFRSAIHTQVHLIVKHTGLLEGLKNDKL